MSRSEGGESSAWDSSSKKQDGEQIIRLRGLPWDATEDDVRKFCSPSGVDISSVHFILDSRGRASGQCFVKTGDADGVDKVLKLSGEHIGKRYVEVFQSSREEMGRHITKSGDRMAYPYQSEERDLSAMANQAERSLRMRGLPFSANVDDVLDFFKGIPLKSADVHFKYNHSGRPSGDCFVCFENVDDQKKALERHKEHMQGRYIELFPCTESEVAISFGNPGGGGHRGGSRGGGWSWRLNGIFKIAELGQMML